MADTAPNSHSILPSIKNPLKDTNTSESPAKKLPNPEARSNIKAKTVHTLTLANPSYTYIHLVLINHDQVPNQPPAPNINYHHPPPPSRFLPSPIDNLTVLKYLHAALRQYLGLHGIAIPVDILKVGEEEEEEEEEEQQQQQQQQNKKRKIKTAKSKQNTDVWIRVPREDGSKVLAAVGGWVGRGEGSDGGIEGRGGTAGVTGTGRLAEGKTIVSWRVKSWGNWLAEIAGGNGADLFR